MKNFQRCTLAYACLMASTTLSAQDATEMEETEVLGKAIPPAVVAVEDDAFQFGRDTGDSLRNVLGVSGSRMGGHAIDPTIRGLKQTQLNVLLDGAYVHGGCPNRMDPPTSYAPAENYEQITIIRGTQTLAYGGGGPGGTILFERVTDRFTDGPGIRGTIQTGYVGNGDTYQTNTDIAFGNPTFYGRVLGSYTDAGNYEDGNGNELRTSYEERGGSILLGYTPSADTRIEASYEQQETLDALFPGAGMDSPEATNEAFRIKFNTTAAIGPFSSLKGELYDSSVDHTMDNYNLRPNAGMKMRAPSTSDTTGGRLIGTINTDSGEWKLGIDAQYNERSARRYNDTMMYGVMNSVLWPDVEINQNGVFGELKHRLNDDTQLIAGLRYDYVTSEAGSADLDPAGMPWSPNQLYTTYYGTTASKDTNHNIGALLRIEHALNADTVLYAGLARTVRTPDATERFIASDSMTPSGRWVGNPDINPEAHHQAELGFQTVKGDWEFEGSVYINEVKDYILRDRFDAPGNYATIYRNIDARLIGGETSVSVAVTPHLLASFGLAYVHAQNTDEDRAIAQTPPLEGNASLEYTNNALTASANWQFAASQPRVDLTSATGIDGQGLDVRQTPGWGVLNLAAGYQFSDALQFEAGIDNALDKAYAQHLNRSSAFDPTQIQVNEPGRSVWVGATYSF